MLGVPLELYYGSARVRKILIKTGKDLSWLVCGQWFEKMKSKTNHRKIAGVWDLHGRSDQWKPRHLHH